MRFLILNTDYFEFRQWFYRTHPQLASASYTEQLRMRHETLFGLADFYSKNLTALGHQASEIYADNELLQNTWAAENMPASKTSSNGAPTLQRLRSLLARTPIRYLKPLVRPLLQRLDESSSMYYLILKEQIKAFRPDVLLNLYVDGVSPHFLREVKPYTRMLIGQVASPFSSDKDFRCYDLMLSSLPNFVEYFSRRGLHSELQWLAFEPSVLARVRSFPERIAVSFIGTLSPFHTARMDLLEYLAERSPIKIWGQGVGTVSETSPIRNCHGGHAWGVDMYNILYNSDITINNHISVAENYANNMRLFESTGTGTFLITDSKKNLQDLFDPEREIATYRSKEECFERIQFYLQHAELRREIAQSGKARTHSQHTYRERMKQLVSFVHKYLPQNRSRSADYTSPTSKTVNGN